MTPNNTEILKSRARALAQIPIAAQSPDATIEIIEFRLAQEYYGIERKYVDEVLPLTEFTPLPCTPAFLPGMINLRGKVLAVIDIKKFFGLPDEGITDLHTILIVRAGDIEAGILADLVGGVRSVPRTSIQPSLPTLTGIRAAYLKGVTDQRVAILDVLAILTDPAILVNENVEHVEQSETQTMHAAQQGSQL